MKKRQFDIQLFAVNEDRVLTTEHTATYAGAIEDHAEAHAYYDRALKEAIYEEYDLEQYCDTVTVQRNSGKTVTFRKLLKYVANADALVEGVVPREDDPMSFIEFSLRMQSYAGYITYTPEIDIYAIDKGWGPRLQRNQGNAVGEKFQEKVRNAFWSSKNRWLAGVAEADLANGLDSAREKVTALKLSELVKIRTLFHRMKVKPMQDGYYHFLISPEVEAGLLSLAKSNNEFTFIELAKDLGKSDVIYKGTIGTWLDIKFIRKDCIKAIAEKNDGTEIHGCVMLGRYNNEKGVKLVKLAGAGEPRSIIKEPGSSGAKIDPVDQIGSIGWRNDGWGVTVLYPEAVLVYECTGAMPIYDETDEERALKNDHLTNVYSDTGVVADTKEHGLMNGTRIEGYTVTFNEAYSGKSAQVLGARYFADETATINDIVASFKADYPEYNSATVYTDVKLETEVTGSTKFTADTKLYVAKL